MHEIKRSAHIAANNPIKARQQGFSLFEMVIVIVLLAILTGVFLQRILSLQEMTEKTVMEITVTNMRTGLRYKIAKLMIESGSQDFPPLLDENPINWLQKPPENYQGEFTSLSDKEILPGNWYFDTGAKLLVYRLNLDNHFVSKQKGISEIRFKVINLTKNSQRDETEVKSVVGIKLNAISAGQWF